MIYIVMGVSGSGKSTVGMMLAAELGYTFYDADDFHPLANVNKMAQRIPLTDSDRLPWLQTLRALNEDLIRRKQHAVLACSALRQAYRDMLCVDPAQVKFIYLKGDYEVIHQRMLSRDDHFMTPAMLQSQFEALEEPSDALIVQVDQPLGEIIQEIKVGLGI